MIEIVDSLDRHEQEGDTTQGPSRRGLGVYRRQALPWTQDTRQQTELPTEDQASVPPTEHEDRAEQSPTKRGLGGYQRRALPWTTNNDSQMNQRLRGLESTEEASSDGSGEEIRVVQAPLRRVLPWLQEKEQETQLQTPTVETPPVATELGGSRSRRPSRGWLSADDELWAEKSTLQGQMRPPPYIPRRIIASRDEVWNRGSPRPSESVSRVGSLVSRVSPWETQNLPRPDRGGGLGDMTLSEMIAMDTQSDLTLTSNLVRGSRPTQNSNGRGREISLLGNGEESEWEASSTLPLSTTEDESRQALSLGASRGSTEVLTRGQERILTRPAPDVLDTRDPSVFQGVPVWELAGRGSKRPTNPEVRRPTYTSTSRFYTDRVTQEAATLQSSERVRPFLPGVPGIKQSRLRIGWIEEEVARLLRLWMRMGNRWAEIKRIDAESEQPRLTLRTDVDLKDKLRTIKKWMLRYECLLILSLVIVEANGI